MKKYILLFLATMPTMTFVQSNASLDAKMHEYNSHVQQFLDSWQYYTKCFRTSCSSEEKYRRWESASTNAKKVLKSAALMITILYGIYFMIPKGHKRALGEYIAKKRSTITIEQASKLKPSEATP